MWNFFVLREMLVHTCIHLKSHWLHTLLSCCAYPFPAHQKKKAFPWLHRRMAKISDWCGGSRGILQPLMSKWGECFESARHNAAIWGCCRSWSSPWFWWCSRKKPDQTGASSGTLLASLPSLYDLSVLAVSLFTSSVPVATFGRSIRFQNKCARADLPRIYTKCEMKTDLVILVKLSM